MKQVVIGMMVGVLCAGSASRSHATPSTQIWIPSTDVQAFNVWHLGLDNYFRSTGSGEFTAGKRDPNVYDAGMVSAARP